MLKKRVIPVLFLKNGLIVRSQGFVDFREFGNPIDRLRRLNDWQADELIYIDITREGEHNLKRDDHKIKRMQSTLEILGAISRECFMPLTFGGRIRDFREAADYIAGGADKVIINTESYRHPELIARVAGHFGRQCMVVGIDVKRVDGRPVVFIDQGREAVRETPAEWARSAEASGAGEIFLNSIDRDGAANGFDLEIIEEVAAAVNIPVIACGGAGTFDDMAEVMQQTQASAVAAGNIFNFTENAYRRSKRELSELGLPVKPLASPVPAMS
ncbi:MAG: imidazole glycerol phosphate synthase subunit HisF [Candidatus Omnitrophica bacterium]|nr:imidazole glycerol phosphate synthase subunit HisF [Candidatus Omnitrophota bacterium]